MGANASAATQDLPQEQARPWQHSAMASGTVVAVGGAEAEALTPQLGNALREIAQGEQALILPIAAAFERPEQVALEVATWLGEQGWLSEALMVTSHAEANDEALVARLAEQQLVVLTSGAALHLRQVLLRSKLVEALASVHANGGTVLGIGAGAHVLADPMFDERGGGVTTGAGLCEVVLATAPSGDDYAATFSRCATLLDPDLDLLAVPAGAAVAVGEGGFEALVGTTSWYRGGALVEELGR